MCRLTSLLHSPPTLRSPRLGIERVVGGSRRGLGWVCSCCFAEPTGVCNASPSKASNVAVTASSSSSGSSAAASQEGACAGLLGSVRAGIVVGLRVAAGDDAAADAEEEGGAPPRPGRPGRCSRCRRAVSGSCGCWAAPCGWGSTCRRPCRRTPCSGACA